MKLLWDAIGPEFGAVMELYADGTIPAVTDVRVFQLQQRKATARCKPL